MAMRQSRAGDVVAEALHAVLVSPNEADSNLEPANVVDGLFAIARAIRALAHAVGEHGQRVAGRADQDQP
jgi:hypothetical protein